MYSIRAITHGDYILFKHLYRACFRLELSEQAFRDKYFLNGTLNTIGMFALDSKGKPAAYYGVFLCSIVFENKDYLAAQSGDTMTHPLHQKRGLFTQLAKAVFSECLNRSVSLIFGFPNSMSYSGFANKLSWTFTGNLRKWVIRTGGVPFCELTSYNSLARWMYLKVAFYFLKPYSFPANGLSNEFFEPSNARGFVRIDSTKKLSALSRRGIRRIKCGEWDILIKLENHLVVGDVVFRDVKDAKDLLKALNRLSKRLGCSKFVFVLSPNHWLTPLLEAEVPSSNGLPIGFLDLNSGIDLTQIVFRYADFDTF